MKREERLLQVLRGTAVGLVVVAVLGAWLIGRGAFDPPLPGTVAGEVALAGQTVEPHEQTWTWLQQRPSAPYTVRLTVAADGPDNVLAGLVVGDAATFLAVAVSPLGYVTIWQGGPTTAVLLPLQTWPHVHVGAGVNEIQVERTGNGRLTVRINREWLWQGEVQVGEGLGLVAENRGEATAVLLFQSLQWQDTPSP